MSMGSRNTVWSALVAAALATLSTTGARAYTADQQALCTNDAFRLCSSAIPDVDRVTACMIQKRAQLSPGCAQFFRKPAAQPVAASKRKAAPPRKTKPKRSN